jgi:drug/metabolite transporter (DMT)-like permease
VTGLEDEAPSWRKTSLGLGLAVAAVSSAALFVRLADPIDHSLIAAGRVCVTALGLASIAPRSLAEAIRRCVRDPVLGLRVLLAGTLLAVHFATWIASLTMTTVLRSVALVSTQPLFAGLLGRLVGDEAPWPLYVGTVVAIAGTVIMVGHGVDPGASVGELAWLGDGLALAGAITAAGYLTVGRSVKDRLPLAGYFALVNIVAALALLALAAPRAAWSTLAEAESSDLLFVLYIGLVPGVIGHGLLNWAVRRAPVHVVSLAVLLEPVGASALAWAVLAERVEALDGVGALVVLVGVGVGLWPVTGPRSDSDPPTPTSSPTV